MNPRLILRLGTTAAVAAASVIGISASPAAPGSDTAATVERPTCRGKPATIVGSDDDWTIVGTPGRDVIVGGGQGEEIKGLGGNDLICGGWASDGIAGGRGDDRLFGQGSSDLVTGGPGDDFFGGGRQSRYDTVDYSESKHGLVLDLAAGTVRNGRATDRIGKGFIGEVYGSPHADRMYGTARHDQLDGGRGDDVLHGRGGWDILDGSTGADIVRGGAGEDRVVDRLGGATSQAFGGPGDDWLLLRPGDGSVIDGGAGQDDLKLWRDRRIVLDLATERLTVPTQATVSSIEIVRGTTGRDELFGSAAAETLHGIFGRDVISGRGGDDRIFGGEYRDTIDGGPGTDRANGGPGPDICTNVESPRSCED